MAIYVGRGLDPSLADQVADQLMALSSTIGGALVGITAALTNPSD